MSYSPATWHQDKAQYGELLRPDYMRSGPWLDIELTESLPENVQNDVMEMLGGVHLNVIRVGYIQ